VLREPTRLIAYRRLLLDVLLTAGSFLIAHQVRSNLGPWLLPSLFPGGLYPLASYLPLLAVALPLWMVLLAAQRLTAPGQVLSLRREALKELQVAALGVIVLAAVGYLFRLHFISRPFLILFGMISGGVLATVRVVERRTRWGRRLAEVPQRVVVIVGCGAEAAAIARQITAREAWGLSLRGLVDADGCGRSEVEGFPVVATAAGFPELLSREVVDEVVLAVPTRQLGELEPVLLQCQELGVRARVALQPFPHLRPHVEVETLDGTPLLTFATMPIAPLALFAKRVLDVSLALLTLVVSSPVWLAAALAVRLTSRGPVLYRQVRCGLHGRRFVLLKFRTMVEGAESLRGEVAHLNVMDGPVFKAPADPRVTPVGRLLRRSSLDELPQLLNVVKGDMSLVGPRPPIPQEVDRYEPWQRRRLAMKPGITCLWQISGRSELDFATWMELDLAYIDNWSLWLDFKILVLTVPAVFSGRGAA
jgi:exopolysaccharide biosynthesis polyprenyl glycosylphosphotransferase